MAIKDYIRERFFPHMWCQGCGHGIVLNSLLRGVEQLGMSKNEIVMVSGIGCSSRISGYVDFHSLHTLHGRALGFATGVKMSNPELNVIVPMGDGATRSDVIISDAAIRYPKVTQPNVLVCLTQEAYNKFSGIVRPGGMLVTDVRYVKMHAKVDARQIQLPMYKTVMDEIGKPIVFNICMLGAVIGITQLVKPESIVKVLEKRIPPGFLDMSRQALDLGLSLGEPHGG